MIHLDVQFGIIYGGVGLKYAGIFAEIIRKKEAGPVTTVLVDDYWKPGAGTIDERIF